MRHLQKVALSLCSADGAWSGPQPTSVEISSLIGLKVRGVSSLVDSAVLLSRHSSLLTSFASFCDSIAQLTAWKGAERREKPSTFQTCDVEILNLLSWPVADDRRRRTRTSWGNRKVTRVVHSVKDPPQVSQRDVKQDLENSPKYIFEEEKNLSKYICSSLLPA